MNRGQTAISYLVIMFLLLTAFKYKCEKDGGSVGQLMTQLLHESEEAFQMSERKKGSVVGSLSGTFLKNPRVSFGNTILWDLFTPSFHCPRSVERVGNLGDGGKWVCGFRQITAKRDCVVYSFGVGGDSSFEAEILERTQCLVRMYDHTVDALNPAYQLTTQYGKAEFYPLGIGVGDSLVSLESQMERHGDKVIDILKMDVEGAEFEVLPAMADYFRNELPFRQLLLEVHLEREIGFIDIKDLFTMLNECGLRAVHSEANLLQMLNANHSFVECYEFTFINLRLVDGDYFA